VACSVWPGFSLIRRADASLRSSSYTKGNNSSAAPASPRSIADKTRVTSCITPRATAGIRQMAGPRLSQYTRRMCQPATNLAVGFVEFGGRKRGRSLATVSATANYPARGRVDEVFYTNPRRKRARDLTPSLALRVSISSARGLYNLCHAPGRLRRRRTVRNHASVYRLCMAVIRP